MELVVGVLDSEENRRQKRQFAHHEGLDGDRLEDQEEGGNEGAQLEGDQERENGIFVLLSPAWNINISP